MPRLSLCLLLLLPACMSLTPEQERLVEARGDAFAWTAFHSTFPNPYRLTLEECATLSVRHQREVQCGTPDSLTYAKKRARKIIREEFEAEAWEEISYALVLAAPHISQAAGSFATAPAGATYVPPSMSVAPDFSWGRPRMYVGELSANRYDPDSVSNSYGAGNPYRSDSVNNPYGPYGSPLSPRSATNPYAYDAPRLYDQQGNYRGKLSANPYDPDSISNPFGRYGNRFSPDSLNNPFGAGNPFDPGSPTNPFGEGWRIEGQ